MQKIVVISGATACGKTDISIELAAQLNGEIISADSMQIYKYMDIGTAKPTKEEMKGIPHYLIDELFPDDNYSVALFCRLAHDKIKEISSRGKIPFVVGGTGFYINALLKGTEFSDNEDISVRRQFEEFAATHGVNKLYEKLVLSDPEYAKIVHPNNIKRVVRALEYIHKTGEKFSVYNEREKSRSSAYDARCFVFFSERKSLYQRINIRVDKMFEKCFAEEVDCLLKMGYNMSLNSMRGLGYKEVVPYVRGEITLTESAELLKKNTRHFAKRQLTWFLGSYAVPGQTCVDVGIRSKSNILTELGKEISK
ncbi:MAG: tRNA (adenosine(37)-N6)-dimethylallyltransferase MiaA [Clostridiales bacterium]|jgi:tRNA dimethylallyltransferase|nr:tRNA (adenosine(37)-N6)-dimethylallyltransferase MiaA [Clostridiales bacterium]